MAKPAHFVPPKGVQKVLRAPSEGPRRFAADGIARETKNVAKNQHGR